MVTKLQDRITLLCSRRDEKVITANAAAKSDPAVEPTPSSVETFVLLQRELANNVDCLFVFVEHPEVEPTNNRSERNARREAEIRKGARTSKTASGAKRRGIIVTVLASRQTRIANVTLSNMLPRSVDGGRPEPRYLNLSSMPSRKKRRTTSEVEPANSTSLSPSRPQNAVKYGYAQNGLLPSMLSRESPLRLRSAPLARSWIFWNTARERWHGIRIPTGESLSINSTRTGRKVSCCG